MSLCLSYEDCEVLHNPRSGSPFRLPAYAYVPRSRRIDRVTQSDCKLAVFEDHTSVTFKVANLANFCPYCGRLALAEIWESETIAIVPLAGFEPAHVDQIRNAEALSML